MKEKVISTQVGKDEFAYNEAGALLGEVKIILSGHPEFQRFAVNKAFDPSLISFEIGGKTVEFLVDQTLVEREPSPYVHDPIYDTTLNITVKEQDPKAQGFVHIHIGQFHRRNIPYGLSIYTVFDGKDNKKSIQNNTQTDVSIKNFLLALNQNGLDLTLPTS